MSKEAKKELDKQDVSEDQTKQAVSESANLEEKAMNISDYLALHEGEYESDVALFFKNKFRNVIKSEGAWDSVIADFLEKMIV